MCDVTSSARQLIILVYAVFFLLISFLCVTRVLFWYFTFIVT